MKRIGVIGLAGMGERRLECFTARDDVEIASVCTRNETLLAERAAAFGVTSTTTDWESLIADKSLDAVCICTPNNLHHEMATAALKAGLDVLLEYPLSVSLEQVQTLSQTVRDTGKVLHMGMTTRQEPQQLAIKERIATLGDPVTAEGQLCWPEIWKWSARDEVMGSFFALANCHLADQLVDLYGAPAWVTGSLWKRRNDDGANAKASGGMFFGYESGFSAHVVYSMALHGLDEFMRFRLVHAEGAIEFREGKLTVTTDAGVEDIPLTEGDGTELDTAMFLDAMDNPADAMSIEDMGISTRLCLLAERSAANAGMREAL
jgi:predicted dehydrogenase